MLWPSWRADRVLSGEIKTDLSAFDSHYRICYNHIKIAKGSEKMTYLLMNKDTPWLLFSCEHDEFGEIRLKELEWFTEKRPSTEST